MSLRKIVLVGGGSGGHFYPLIAIAEALHDESAAHQKPEPDLYFFGPDPYDSNSLDALGITYVYCPAGKIRKYFSLFNITDSVKLLFGILIACIKLLLIYPDVIMSKGGYTSVPVVIAGWLLRIPIVIHESDAVPGSANRLAAHFATYVAISYPDTLRSFPAEKTVLTGIPVRKRMLTPVPDAAQRSRAGQNEFPTLLILGGSQGADRINQLILESLDELLPHYVLLHQTGGTLFDGVTLSAKTLIRDEQLLSHYHPVAFLSAEQLHVAMTESALIVSRAGSGSIFEIALHGKPSILIPIPEEISHDQRTNAYAYARTGAGVVMEEKNLRDGLLAAEIARIMGDQAMYASMSDAAKSFVEAFAAEKIALTLLQIAESH